MKKLLFICLTIGLTILTAFAAEWSFEYKQADLKYALYSGSLGDPVMPNKKNAKAAFEITGKAAKEIFDVIGPDKKDACTEEEKTRVRSRDGDKLLCMLSVEGEYSCYFGFDLKTGKSIGGSIC